MSLRSLLGFGGRSAGPTSQARAIEALLDSGIAAYESGDLNGAERAFATALVQAPEHPRALNLMGVVRLANGDAPRAESLIRAAIKIDPAPSLFWFNLGNALIAQSRESQAADAFEAASTRSPSHFPSLFNLGNARLALGQFDAAIAAGKRFAAMRPDDPAVQAALGTMHYRKAAATLLVAEFDMAIDRFRLLLDHPEALPAAVANARLLMGDALSKRGRHIEALPLFTMLHLASPQDLEANVNLANCLNSLGRIADATPYYETVLRLSPAHLPAISSSISASDYDPRIDAAENTRERMRLMRRFADPARQREWPNSREPERRLRLGYVSPDFREHVAMTLFEGVLAHHDREHFEIFAYDATPFRDARNAALRGRVDHWREIEALDTAAATTLIRADRIDLLVDLAGHTAGNRLMVFARKPAPVQASWLAYPGSTGLPEIDYIVSDPSTSPADCAAFYSEKIWRLPITRFCFMPSAASPAPGMPAPDAPITFACFNNISKINPAVLALWKAILDGLPAARLLFKYATLDDPSGRAWLGAQLSAAGIDTSRVDMRGWTPYTQSLGDYADVHIALDPFPFCGGLTSLDALWMGVPVVTLSQKLMAGRQTEAFLATLGHPELIAADRDQYVRIAIELARDLPRIAAYRRRLRGAMQGSALFDYAGFTRDLESAWRGMWRVWCGQEDAMDQSRGE